MILVADIQQAVAEHYGITREQLLSRTRKREIARPRQVAMWLCRGLTPRSLPEIAKHFRFKDHTNVVHAIRQVRKLLDTDAEFDGDVQQIFARLAA